MLDLKDAYDLANTICGAFHEERFNEFETLNGDPESITSEGSSFLIYNTRLEALLSYKAFLAHKTINAAMIWREMTWTIGKDPKVNWGEEFIVLIDVSHAKINKGTFDI